MFYKTKGIVIQRIKYSETSLIVKIYTEIFGLQTYIVKGVRSRKSKIKSNVFQNLSLLDLVVSKKEKSKINFLTEIRLAYQFTTIPFDIRKSSIVMFLNEILHKTIREEEPNQNLFDFLFNSIQLLDHQQKDFANFHLLFLIKLTKHLGFFPHQKQTEQFRYFDLTEGIFIKGIPIHQYYLNTELSLILNDLLNISFEKINELKISKIQRMQLLEKLIDYYKIHVENFKEIKSLAVLQTVLN
ncbi:MAG: DNA repair protein RecO [Bacteroidales bacterium]|nr:DNA repair protein RecO [Bacteroidales bacterium]